MTEWVGTLQRTARAALDNAVNSLSSSARDLKAAAQAEKVFVFGREMKKLRDNYPHYFTHTRTAGGK
jgi:hypothetical protein